MNGDLKFNFPALQVALDVTDGRVAEDLALKCWVDDHVWIEAGTPLIKSVGVGIIGCLRRLLPKAVIFADMKCMDAGFVEAELASVSGANLMSVLGVANDATIIEAVKACRRYGTGVVVDLISISNPLQRAFEVQGLGVDMVCFHTGIDVQKSMGISAYEGLIEYISKACKSLNIPVAVAGGITLDKVRPLMDAGVKVIVVGSAITKSSDPRETTIKFVREILK
ncbi:MAG: orotidine 5'-phosphate decarboxylase [archaeon YNP-WB-040]|nr:orotidine 5'-phosphate decarboxylase [Candidatus Culexarchaeum yellowstonense]